VLPQGIDWHQFEDHMAKDARLRLSRADGTTANRRNSPQPLPWTS
jgi:hypothetical protein